MGSFRVLILTFLMFVFTCAAAAQDAAKYYEENCASCHSIGGGYLAGPDLKDVTKRADRKWLIDFMRDPETKAADPYAAKMIAQAEGVLMPGYPDLTDARAEQLLVYIEQQSGATPAEAAPAMAAFTPAEIAEGRQIFLGAVHLGRGGAACIACHQAAGLPTRGGKLGPDLSRAYDRFGQERGLTAWLKSPPTPVMRSIYHDKQLNESEVRSLVAFFHETQETAEQFNEAPVRAVQLGGIGASLVGALVIGFVFRDRSSGRRRKLTTRRDDQ